MEQGESWPPHFPSSACSLSFSHLQLLPTLQGTSPSGTWKSSSPAKLCPHILSKKVLFSSLGARGDCAWAQGVTLPSGGWTRGRGPCRPWEQALFRHGILESWVAREWSRRETTGSVQAWPLGPVDLTMRAGVWPEKDHSGASEATAENRASEFYDRVDVDSAGWRGIKVVLVGKGVESSALV